LLAVKFALPELGASALVGDGNHNDVPGFNGVNEAIGKAPNKDATKTVGNWRSELGTLPDGVNRMLEVIEEIMSETRRR
jgi:hypothetical protein